MSNFFEPTPNLPGQGYQEERLALFVRVNTQPLIFI